MDTLDYFLIGALVGSVLASRLKDYLSQEKAMARLKNSIIQKSKLVIKSDKPILSSKEGRIKKVYEFSNEVLKLAQDIKGLVERLAVFLKERELKGVAKILFKNGRLVLELILHKCSIDITYSLLTEGLTTQVIVITATAGGAAGFTISWFSAGASLVAPPILININFN